MPRRPWRRLFWIAATSLGGKRREVLLACLEGLRFFVGSPLKVHAEPEDRNKDACNSSRYVLRRLQTLVARELLDLGIVALNFRHNSGAIHKLVLRLNYSYRCRRSSGATR